MQNNNNFSNKFMPTLRLSITDDCHGLCPFCHKEGLCNSATKTFMPLDYVTSKVIPAIKKIGINKVILTGGEPTLHPDLSEIARAIRTECPKIIIGMTTNGEVKERLFEAVDYLDKVTISLSSYRPEVYMKHTRVEPYSLISFINDCHPKAKAASIVITEDNIQDVFQIILYLINQQFDVKLQFIIGKSKITRKQRYEFYRKLCAHFGDSQIILASTPSFMWNVTGNSTIRLKWEELSKFIYDSIEHRKACSSCPLKNECVERGCAIRVHPNGDVSPCLNNYKPYRGNDLIKSLEEAYDDMKIV